MLINTNVRIPVLGQSFYRYDKEKQTLAEYKVESFSMNVKDSVGKTFINLSDGSGKNDVSLSFERVEDFGCAFRNDSNEWFSSVDEFYSGEKSKNRLCETKGVDFNAIASAAFNKYPLTFDKRLCSLTGRTELCLIGQSVFFKDGVLTEFVDDDLNRNFHMTYSKNGYDISFDLLDGVKKEDIYQSKGEYLKKNVSIKVIPFNDGSEQKSYKDGELYTFISRYSEVGFTALLDHVSSQGVIYIQNYSKDKNLLVHIEVEKIGTLEEFTIVESDYNERENYYYGAFTALIRNEEC